MFLTRIGWIAAVPPTGAVFINRSCEVPFRCRGYAEAVVFGPLVMIPEEIRAAAVFFIENSRREGVHLVVRLSTEGLPSELIHK